MILGRSLLGFAAHLRVSTVLSSRGHGIAGPARRGRGWRCGMPGRCVRVNICYDALPPGIRDQVGWSATLQISSLADPNQRARLATAAATERWPVAKVKEAVALAGQHRLWDAEPDQPGLQLPEPKDPSPPQPGRLVTQSEKWTEQIGSWRKEFERVDASKLSKAHVERMRLAVAAARGQLDELERRLGR